MTDAGMRQYVTTATKCTSRVPPSCSGRPSGMRPGKTKTDWRCAADALAYHVYATQHSAPWGVWYVEDCDVYVFYKRNRRFVGRPLCEEEVKELRLWLRGNCAKELAYAEYLIDRFPPRIGSYVLVFSAPTCPPIRQ
jgi:hypothetical protein